MTLENLCGFETGDLKESSTTSGSPDATEAIIVRSGIRSLQMPAAVTPHTFDLLRADFTLGGHATGFAFYTTDKTPSSRTLLFSFIGAGPQAIYLATSGNIQVDSDEGTQRFDISDPLTENTWHYIVLWTDGASPGDAELFIDGDSVGTVANTGDWTPGGNTARFSGPGSGDGTYYFDDYRSDGGISTAAAAFKNCEVFGYQSGANTTRTGTPKRAQPGFGGCE